MERIILGFHHHWSSTVMWIWWIFITSMSGREGKKKKKTKKLGWAEESRQRVLPLYQLRSHRPENPGQSFPATHLSRFLPQPHLFFRYLSFWIFLGSWALENLKKAMATLPRKAYIGTYPPSLTIQGGLWTLYHPSLHIWSIRGLQSNYSASYGFLIILISLKKLRLEQKLSHLWIPLLKEKKRFLKEKKNVEVRKFFIMVIYLLRNEGGKRKNRRQLILAEIMQVQGSINCL